MKPVRTLRILYSIIGATALWPTVASADKFEIIKSYPFKAMTAMTALDDDRLIAAVDHCGTIAVFDLRREGAFWERRLETGPPCLKPEHFMTVAFTSEKLFVGRIEHAPIELDPKTGKTLREFDDSGKRGSYKIALSDDRRLLSGIDPRTGFMHIWQIETGKVIKTLNLNEKCGEMLGVQWANDSEHLAVSCPEGIEIWNWTNATKIKRLELKDESSLSSGRTRMIAGSLLSSGFRFAAVGGLSPESRYSVMVMDVKSGRTIRTWPTKTDEIKFLFFSQDEADVCGMGYEGRIHCWHIAEDTKFFEGFTTPEYGTQAVITPTSFANFSTDLRTVVHRSLDDGIAVARRVD